MNDDELKKAEDLLNQPRAEVFLRKRSRFAHIEEDLDREWHIPVANSKKTLRGPQAALIIALCFFVGAVGYAGYLVWGGNGSVSGDNIDLAVNGPASVDGGEPITLEVVVGNTNPSPLELANLTVTFPDGTRAPDKPQAPLRRYRKDFDSIGANQSVNDSLTFILYGPQNSDKTIILDLEYRAKGVNAIFDKQKTFTVHVVNAPLALTLRTPSDTNSGDPITLSLDAVSNSKQSIANLLATINYPPGFSFVSADPAPVPGTNNVWRLDDLPPQGTRTVTIKGALTGQDNELKTVSASIGTASSDETKAAIAVPYNQAQSSVSIRRPFVSLSATVASLNDETVNVEGGDVVRGSVSWVNNLPSRVVNGTLAIAIRGAVLDQKSVAADGGFYRSSDNTIVFDQSTTPTLASLDAGATGTGTFSLASLPLLTDGASIFAKPEIDLTITFTGTRLADGVNPGGPISSVLHRTVRVNTNTQLVSRAVHYLGPFTNTGPMPPKANSETTYTIIWSVINSSNDLAQSTVKASLPNYARFVGSIAPKDEKVSYDATTGVVTWNLDIVKAGSGLTLPPREVAFQVGVTPSVSQEHLLVPLTGDATLTGTDSFTTVPRSSTKQALTTEILSDTKAHEGEYRVVQ